MANKFCQTLGPLLCQSCTVRNFKKNWHFCTTSELTAVICHIMSFSNPQDNQAHKPHPVFEFLLKCWQVFLSCIEDHVVPILREHSPLERIHAGNMPSIQCCLYLPQKIPAVQLHLSSCNVNEQCYLVADKLSSAVYNQK